MILAASLKNLLEAYGVPYRVFQHPRAKSLREVAALLKIDPALILKAQILEDQQGFVLAVHCLDRQVDVDQLKKLLNRNFNVPPLKKINRLFKDCEADCWPPIGQAYALETIIDKRVENCSEVFFVSGSNTALVQIKLDDFWRISRRAKTLSFTQACSLESENKEDADKLVLPELPSLPPVVLQVLQLIVVSDETIEQLANKLAQNSALQQQILLYARQPYQAMDQIVLVAANNNLENNNTADIWLHALYAASYAEQITRMLNSQHQLDPAISFLAGLFHNMGLLLFSQLFPPEYALLCKWMRANPKTSIAVLENRLLGMGAAFNVVREGHSKFGESLLRHWHLPEAICVVAREHHNLNYQGEYHKYVKIMQLTNQLLKEKGVGDGSEDGIIPKQLEFFVLSEVELRQKLSDINSRGLTLDIYAIIAGCIST